MKKRRSATGVAEVVFLLVGVCFLLVSGAVFAWGRSIRSSYVETTAVITGFGGSYSGSAGQRRSTSSTYVQYTVDGAAYECRLNSYSSLWEEGDAIAVLYDPENPAKAMGKDLLWLLPAIFGSMGLIFTAVGGGFFISRRRLRARREALLQDGYPITAEIVDIAENRMVRVNGRHPRKLECRFTESDGTIHIFCSENIWEYVDDSVIGKTVTVYVAPSGMERYYVDLDSITGMPAVAYHEN